MSHPYLKLTTSGTYPAKLVVGKTARATPYSDGLTDKSVTVVEIPSIFNGIEVAEVGHLSFYQLKITSIFIPKTVLRICQEAFSLCNKLTDVRFEAGSKLQRLDYLAFWSCTSLKRIDFPASVSNISEPSSFFYNVALDCFSYAGTIDFSSLSSNFFGSVTNIYVSNDYTGTSFAGKTITGRGQTCTDDKMNKQRQRKVSVCFRRINIPFHHYMFLLVQS